MNLKTASFVIVAFLVGASGGGMWSWGESSGEVWKEGRLWTPVIQFISASWQTSLQLDVNRHPARVHKWPLEVTGHALIAAAEMHQRAPFFPVEVSQCNYGAQTWMHRSNISVMSPPGAEWMEHLLNNAFVLLVHIILWENAIRNISISLCLLHEIAFFSRAELKHHRCAIRKWETLWIWELWQLGLGAY